MVKKTKTNQEILDLYRVFSQKTDIKSTNYNYFKIQNKIALQKEGLPLQKIEDDVNANIKEYNDEYGELLKKYANKDDKGNPIELINNGYMISYDVTPENRKLVISESEKLKETKYKKNFTAFEKAKKDFEKILLEKQGINLHTIKRKDLPDNLDDFTLECIYDFIE